jgi:ABC-type branched-subunit amino acid transport system substrate-binding protein
MPGPDEPGLAERKIPAADESRSAERTVRDPGEHRSAERTIGAPDEPRYAERMFPPPADHGIARPDRATSTVQSGTDTARSGDYRNERWYQGSGRIGQLTADLMDPVILAVEDALNEGVYDRPVEIVTVDARGLPRENYRKVRQGYAKLAEDGCVVVIGPFISDNSVNVRDLVNATGVPCLGWTGTTRFHGEYCFTVANGDIPTESWMGADWCFANGYARVGFFWEQGSSGDLYADYFRAAARHYDLDVVKETRLGPNPRNFERNLAAMRDRGAEALVYMGYGYSTFHFAAGFKALGWDPPRFMGTAFMFYSNSNAWAAGLEGWHGVDQLGEDGANPNYEAMLQRFEARFGRVSRNVVVALSYDTARAAMAGIGNARIATPEEVKAGLEQIKWMPCANGGPGCYLTFAEYDHRGYKGDFLTIRELRGGELRFRGYYRPQHPSNTRSPLLKKAELKQEG